MIPEKELTFQVYRQKVKRKEIPRYITVHEKEVEGWKHWWTGIIHTYKLESIRYSKLYTDCWEVTYSLVER